MTFYFFYEVHADFGFDIEELANSVANASELDLSKEDVIKALQKMELNENIRGEALTLIDFARLTGLLDF